jgi:HK97 family phage portal protein
LAERHPLYSLLTLSPNPEMSAMVLKQSVTAQTLLWGAGYIELQRNGAGNIVAMWPRGAWATRPVRSQKTGVLEYETSDNHEHATKYISQENMIYLPYVSLDGMVGMSPISCARRAFGTGLSLDKFGARFFGNFATPKLALEVPNKMKPEDKARARSDWEMQQSGANQHRLAILDNGQKLTQLSIPPEDAQFLQTHQMSDRRICAMFGVPPHMAGDLDKAIKSNVEQQGIEVLQYTLSPMLTRWKQELQRKLFPTIGRSAGRYVIGFDVRDLLRPDAASRQSYYQSGIQNGYLTQNEVREEEGYNPYEEGVGSQPSIQLNMQPLANMLGAQVQKDDDQAIPQQNSLASRLARVYLPLFSDGMSRFLHRSKRDQAGLLACVGPCLESVSVTLRGPAVVPNESLSELARQVERLLVCSEQWDADKAEEELQTSVLGLMSAAGRDIAAAREARAKEKHDDEEEQ